MEYVNACQLVITRLWRRVCNLWTSRHNC